VKPKQAVCVVLKHWHDMPAAQIGQIALDVRHATAGDENDTGEADLLASLQLCKGINDSGDLRSLAALWNAITGGADGASFGGLDHAHESRNIKATIRFAEALFLPKAFLLLDAEFNTLAVTATAQRTAEARTTAYFEALNILSGYVNGFDLSDKAVGRMERCSLPRWSDRVPWA